MISQVKLLILIIIEIKLYLSLILQAIVDSFNQEKKNNKEVREFCEFNFNIDFILSEISDVKGENAHDIYKWAKNVYGKSAVPKWNFHKILVDKNGQIIETFVSFTSPLSNKIIQAIEKSL